MKRLALLGLAFLLALAVPILAACQESDESPETASGPNYDDGHDDGYGEGYEQGYDAGYAKGWQDGFALGEDVGYQKGCQAHGEPSSATESTGYLYVGSINSNVYHYPYCRYVAQIYPQNRIWFASAADALWQGYRPCKDCKPPG